jgi:hypothetical protein
MEMNNLAQRMVNIVLSQKPLKRPSGFKKC